MKSTVIAISGATPYLGGAETWRPLRHAAPDIHFVVVDPLDFVDAADLDAALAESVREHLPTAAAIVGHFGADRAVVELVRRERPELPIVLISPLTLFANPSRVRIASTICRSAWVGNALTSLARAKLRRLRASRAAVAAQLAPFVGPSFLAGPLVDEAYERICDERTTRTVARTHEFIREMLRLMRDRTFVGANVTVIVGSSLMDRRTARRTRVTAVPGVVASAMIEAPVTVATIVRDIAGIADSVPT